MMWEETCKFLCEVPMTDQIREKLRSMIADEYQVNFLADGLPAATRFRVQNKDTNDVRSAASERPRWMPCLFSIGYRRSSFSIPQASADPLLPKLLLWSYPKQNCLFDSAG